MISLSRLVLRKIQICFLSVILQKNFFKFVFKKRGDQMNKRFCKKEKCFANSNNRCLALNQASTDNCAFFKLPEVVEDEREKAYQRLVLLKRYDLIEKYELEKLRKK